MNVPRKHPALKHPFEDIFKINIVHEDTIAGLHAVGVLNRLAARLGTQLGRDISPWRICTRVWKFEWLQCPEWWEDAVAKSAEADMIIIATGKHSELPVGVRSWIENVLPRRADGLTALVALLDQRGECRARLSARYLRQLARQSGVDFFCNLDDRPERVEAGLKSVLSRFADDSPGAGATDHYAPSIRMTHRGAPPSVPPQRQPTSSRTELCSIRSP